MQIQMLMVFVWLLSNAASHGSKTRDAACGSKPRCRTNTQSTSGASDSAGCRQTTFPQRSTGWCRAAMFTHKMLKNKVSWLKLTFCFLTNLWPRFWTAFSCLYSQSCQSEPHFSWIYSRRCSRFYNPIISFPPCCRWALVFTAAQQLCPLNLQTLSLPLPSIPFLTCHKYAHRQDDDCGSCMLHNTFAWKLWNRSRLFALL